MWVFFPVQTEVFVDSFFDIFVTLTFTQSSDYPWPIAWISQDSGEVPKSGRAMVEFLQVPSAWCVMPNHVHVLIQPDAPLARIMQSWKSYTGRWALAHNAELGLGVPGKAFWMREYWDRYIRDDRHYRSVVEYIHNNPVKAGVCKQPEDWKWSSAYPG